jgi:hypothetical protein
VNLPKLKCDAPPELVEQVRKIEERCDSWADNLTLLSFSYDVAAWGVLTQIIDLIEQQIRGHGHGSPEQRDAMINLGLAGALLLDRLRSLELPTKDGWLRWTQELKDASKDAVSPHTTAWLSSRALQPGIKTGEPSQCFLQHSYASQYRVPQ